MLLENSRPEYFVTYIPKLAKAQTPTGLAQGLGHGQGVGGTALIDQAEATKTLRNPTLELRKSRLRNDIKMFVASGNLDDCGLGLFKWSHRQHTSVLDVTLHNGYSDWWARHSTSAVELGFAAA